MKLTDTHCHLDLEQFEGDVGSVVSRAMEQDVCRIIVPGIDTDSSRKAVDIADSYEGVYAAVGIHPHGADKASEDDISALRRMAVESEKVVAVGEIGLDYYRMHSVAENQRKLFRGLLETARELALPVILHNRDAGEDFLSILQEKASYSLRGVVHCFSGSPELLKQLLSMDLFISFTGSITFKGAAAARELVKKVPVEKLLLETDAPYMAPEPFRGKRNEPAYVRNILGTYAGIYGMSEEDIARITSHNANELFSLGISEKERIVYPIRDSLYVNLTNRCTNRCSFCTKFVSYTVKGHNLKLDHEPSSWEVISELGDMEKYKEIVFCGLGEPALRLGVLKEVARYAKSKGVRVRINTNGEGNLIEGRPICEDLAGIVDDISVSLNALDPREYQHMCRSVYGERAYEEILSFIRGCSEKGINVEVTCLDCLSDKTISGIRSLAEKIGASLRIRKLNIVG